MDIYIIKMENLKIIWNNQTNNINSIEQKKIKIN
jgi:hypothetical protein